MEFSLLYPTGRERRERALSEAAVNDLSIDFLLEALSENKNERDHMRGLMTKITDDAETIKYRGDIFEDFLRFPELRAAMSELTVRLRDLRDLQRFQRDDDNYSLWSLINRLRELDEYVNSISMIKTTLEKLDIRSAGMKELLSLVTKIYGESGFPELRRDIDETLNKARRLRSVTIGVNLDDLLRPKNAGILSLNDTEFTGSGLLRHFMKFAERDDDIHEGNDISGFRKFHPANPAEIKVTINTLEMNYATGGTFAETSEPTGSDALSSSIKKPVTTIMKGTVNSIKATLNKYVNISGYSLISLMPEISFFVRWAELTDKIKATGMPLCKAEIRNPDGRYCSFKEIYNYKLAINKVNGEDINIITNDLDFDDNGRIFILTGPNRGGKTIITQAVGLSMLLAQWGVFVPCKSAVISPCDNIFTHFPADENDTVDLGRLGEESKRLSEIFEVATKKSLLLLNESLATTSVAEGLFIAKDVVKAMRYIGCRAIFNTHMHDLARDLDELNSSVEGESKALSLVTGIHDGERSFKIALAPPQGVSYAKDIAVKYGVTFEQIKNKVDDI